MVGTASTERGLIASILIHSLILSIAFSWGLKKVKPLVSSGSKRPGYSVHVQLVDRLSSGLSPSAPVRESAKPANAPPSQTLRKQDIVSSTHPVRSRSESPLSFKSKNGVKTSVAKSGVAVSAQHQPRTPVAQPSAGSSPKEADARVEGWLDGDSPNPPPVYPKMARQLGQEGRVRIRLTVRSGWVQGAEVESTSGYPLLDEAALKAIRGWRFRPELNIVYLQRVRFQLR